MHNLPVLNNSTPQDTDFLNAKSYLSILYKEKNLKLKQLSRGLKKRNII
jgi:hypothetical protein